MRLLYCISKITAAKPRRQYLKEGILQITLIKEEFARINQVLSYSV